MEQSPFNRLTASQEIPYMLQNLKVHHNVNESPFFLCRVCKADLTIHKTISFQILIFFVLFLILIIFKNALNVNCVGIVQVASVEQREIYSIDMCIAVLRSFFLYSLLYKLSFHLFSPTSHPSSFT
jgi:hypothetical protein